MKKIIALILVILLLIPCCLTAYAETNNTDDENEKVTEDSKEFNPSMFEGSELYEYDKFEKTWKVTGWYDKEYSDYSLIIGLLMFPSYADHEWGPELRLFAFDKEKDRYDIVDEFYALVDDTIFSYEELEKNDTNACAFG